MPVIICFLKTSEVYPSRKQFLSQSYGYCRSSLKKIVLNSEKQSLPQFLLAVLFTKQIVLLKSLRKVVLTAILFCSFIHTRKQRLFYHSGKKSLMRKLLVALFTQENSAHFNTQKSSPYRSTNLQFYSLQKIVSF